MGRVLGFRVFVGLIVGFCEPSNVEFAGAQFSELWLLFKNNSREKFFSSLQVL